MEVYFIVSKQRTPNQPWEIEVGIQLSREQLWAANPSRKYSQIAIWTSFAFLLIKKTKRKRRRKKKEGKKNNRTLSGFKSKDTSDSSSKNHHHDILFPTRANLLFLRPAQTPEPRCVQAIILTTPPECLSVSPWVISAVWSLGESAT